MPGSDLKGFRKTTLLVRLQVVERLRNVLFCGSISNGRKYQYSVIVVSLSPSEPVVCDLAHRRTGVEGPSNRLRLSLARSQG